MADEKKNPLIGAFRSPEPPQAPLAPKPMQSPGMTAPAQPKVEATKNPEESGKASDSKTTSPITPTKPSEEKKAAEPPKASSDSKIPGEANTTSASVPATPGKTAGEKKTAEPPKPLADEKATGDAKATPITGSTAPSKPNEEKKAAEPSKSPANSEATSPTGDSVPDKPAEEKKPTEPPKAATGSKTPDTAAPGKPTEKQKSTEPPKTLTDSKPTVEPQILSPEEEEDLPKNLHIPLAPTEGGEIVTRLKLDEVHAFEGHPYSVKEDKDMWDLVESVKQFGVLEPAMVIPRDGAGYEIVSGHRRHRACQLAGLAEFPVIIRNLDRDEAIISMVDANLKRENISPMEKARAYDMKLEAMKRKSGRRSKTDILTGEKPKQAVEELAAQTGESATTIKKIRNLVNLNPELQEMVEKNKIPVTTASDIASLKKEEQAVLADAMQREDKVPSITQAAELKAASKAGTLTTEKIESTVAPTKKETDPELKVTFTNDELRSYFPDKQTTVGDVKRVVFEALSLRARALERQAKKEAESKAPAQKPKEKQR